MTHDAALQALLDKNAIYECMLRYTRGLDRLELDLFRSAYWPDAHTCHGTVNGTPDDMLDWWMPFQPGRETGQHAISNLTIEFESDSVAHTESYFLASIKNHGSDVVEFLGGRYVDRFEKREGEWRIKTRILIFDWQATGDASGMAARLAMNFKGSRDRNDMSYERPLQPRLAPPA